MVDSMSQAMYNSILRLEEITNRNTDDISKIYRLLSEMISAVHRIDENIKKGVQDND